MILETMVNVEKYGKFNIFVTRIFMGKHIKSYFDVIDHLDQIILMKLNFEHWHTH